MFSRKCKEHLEEANESGCEHLSHAVSIAMTLQLLVPIIIIHGLMPRFFTKTATDAMKKIVEDRNG